jgi:uncharacterized RDD family membrane protein YckC
MSLFRRHGEVDKTTESNLDLDVSIPAGQSSGRRIISGFWTRLRAILLDSCALSALWYVLAQGPIVFTVAGLRRSVGPLWNPGGWDRLLEFCVFLVYFGVLNSSIAGGQTIFKRIMKIQVIDRSGHSISPGRSFLRSAVLFAPFFFLSGLVKSPVRENAIPLYVALPSFGMVSAIIYLYIANLCTRQSLHDLMVGTFVAQTTPPGQVVGSIRRPHLIVVGVWLAMVGVGLVVTIVADPWALFSWVG